jgi:DNA adenine methylase
MFSTSTQTSLFTELKPFLKWAGGKRQLLDKLREELPLSFNRYFEPFIGAGALLFDMKPQNAFISDINEELINCYLVIRDEPDALRAEISKHKHDESYFYSLRNSDRNPDFKTLSPAMRAARTIFLNKTCFNGLFRVNSKGYFNVPFGKYKNPTIIDDELIYNISTYLNTSDVSIKHQDFETAGQIPVKGDFIYFDPPYDPLNVSSSFTGYQFKFDREDQKRLKEVFADLDKRGCKLLLSNSSTDFIRELYSDYSIIKVTANRAINSVAAKRGKVNELLIKNY